MTRTNKDNARDRGGQNGWWSNILEKIPPKARVVIALVALIFETVIIAVMKRFYGFIVFALLLIGALIFAELIIRRSATRGHNQPNRSPTQDHTQPNLGIKVEQRDAADVVEEMEETEER